MVWAFFVGIACLPAWPARFFFPPLTERRLHGAGGFYLLDTDSHISTTDLYRYPLQKRGHKIVYDYCRIHAWRPNLWLYLLIGNRWQRILLSPTDKMAPFSRTSAKRSMITAQNLFTFSRRIFLSLKITTEGKLVPAVASSFPKSKSWVKIILFSCNALFRISESLAVSMCSFIRWVVS